MLTYNQSNRLKIWLNALLIAVVIGLMYGFLAWAVLGNLSISGSSRLMISGIVAAICTFLLFRIIKFGFGVDTERELERYREPKP